MRIRAPSILLAALCVATVGTVGADTIGIYSDSQGTDCNIVDDQPFLLSVYVVHKSPQGTTAAQYSAPMPSCMTGATWLSDTAAFTVIGNSQAGVALSYGMCATGPIHFLTINYFVQGTSEPCCYYPVLPDPHVSSGQILVVDCNNNTVPGIGEMAVVNGDASCPCGFTLPVEQTTWGQVKALFNE